jgi:hypothetical protein
VSEVVTRYERTVCRCHLDDERNHPPLEIPLWMCEPAACQHLHLTTTPIVDGNALLALKALLQLSATAQADV